MHKSRKIISIAAAGLFLVATVFGFSSQQANAATTSYQSVYNKIINQINAKKAARTTTTTPAPTPAPTSTPTPTPAPSPTPIASSTKCVWTGHCAGDYCKTENDCDGQLVCNSGVCGTAGATTTPAPTPVPAPVVTQTPAPAPTTTPSTSGKIWGAYLSDGNLASFESLVGAKADMQAYFYGWGDSFPASSTLKSQGKTLAIFWEQYGVTLDSIISGAQDAYIKDFADDAKAYGGPVILMPFHEMNGNWDPWDGTVGSNTPAKVVAAWKHVHDLFASATNVKFAWAVNNDSVPDTAENAIANYYPGAGYVDYVGVDGFNFGDQWTFSSVFSSALSQLKTYGKPILITSMASADGAQKASWITEALNTISSDSSIAGFIWFNENKEANWLVNSNPDALQAFKVGIQKF